MDNSINGNSFIMYTSWKELFSALPPDQCQSLLIAIFEYVECGKMPDFQDKAILLGIFKMIRGALDANIKKYNETREKRAEAGRRGAAVRWGGDPQDIANDSKTRQMLASDNKLWLNGNDNLNDNFKENRNDNIPNIIESILEAYPRKGREENTRREIVNRMKEGESPEKLLNAAQIYSKECNVFKSEERFIKCADNFFSKGGLYLSYINKTLDDIKPHEIKEQNKRQPPKKQIPFQNYEQRNYDFSALERQLLGQGNKNDTD